MSEKQSLIQSITDKELIYQLCKMVEEFRLEGEKMRAAEGKSTMQGVKGQAESGDAQAGPAQTGEAKSEQTQAAQAQDGQAQDAQMQIQPVHAGQQQPRRPAGSVRFQTRPQHYFLEKAVTNAQKKKSDNDVW